MTPEYVNNVRKQLALYDLLLLGGTDMSIDVEQIYRDVRLLLINLTEANESEDTVARRRANIEADRYLMEHKETLLPILVDALSRQIRGVRSIADAPELSEAQVAAARLTEAEDTYESYIKQQQEEAAKKLPPFVRWLQQLTGKIPPPRVQYATDTVIPEAYVGSTIKTKDGRYGIVKFKHDNGLLEVQGSKGLFAVTPIELLVVLTMPPKGDN
jgi:hypothetical protein